MQTTVERVAILLLMGSVVGAYWAHKRDWDQGVYLFIGIIIGVGLVGVVAELP